MGFSRSRVTVDALKPSLQFQNLRRGLLAFLYHFGDNEGWGERELVEGFGAQVAGCCPEGAESAGKREIVRSEPADICGQFAAVVAETGPRPFDFGVPGRSSIGNLEFLLLGRRAEQKMNSRCQPGSFKRRLWPSRVAQPTGTESARLAPGDRVAFRQRGVGKTMFYLRAAARRAGLLSAYSERT
jgi:hypothetical protein